MPGPDVNGGKHHEPAVAFGQRPQASTHLRAKSVSTIASPSDALMASRPHLVYFLAMQAIDNMLRAVLVDDHHLFRSGLRGMLETDGIEIVGEATDGVKAVKLVRELVPDVTIIDLKMPNASGIKAIREIVANDPEAKLLALTVSAREADVIDALAAGACGYMLKDTRPDELARGVRLVADGHAVLAGDVARGLARARHESLQDESAADDGVELTERELAVLRLIAAGADNATIGQELSISKHTVKQYVANLFEKLGVSSRVQAAVYAVRKGLV